MLIVRVVRDLEQVIEAARCLLGWLLYHVSITKQLGLIGGHGDAQAGKGKAES